MTKQLTLRDFYAMSVWEIRRQFDLPDYIFFDRMGRVRSRRALYIAVYGEQTRRRA